MKMRKNIITKADFDRLNALLQSRQSRVIYGSVADRLGRELSERQVVSQQHVPGTVVTMNSRVSIRDIKRDKCETYTVVYPQDADINAGRISVLAPLGSALLGASVGDVVEVKAPAGTRRIRVEKVQREPELVAQPA